MSTERDSSGHGWFIGLLLASSLTFYILFFLAIPRLPTNVTLQTDGKRSTQRINLPLIRASSTKPLHISLSQQFLPFQSAVFRFVPDDCVTALSVNGKRLTPFCTFGSSKDINLKPWLQFGKNTLDITIEDRRPTRMGIDVFASSESALPSTLHLLAILTLVAALTTLLLPLLGPTSRTLTPIFIAGVVLRVCYGLSTPWWVRSYDTGAHIDYIRFIATHGSLPSPTGWETHQAPLFYVAAAPFVWLGNVLHLPEAIPLTVIQDLSLFISIVGLGLLLGIITRFFSEKSDRWETIIAAVCAVSFPGLVMISSRISNDPLALATGLLFAFVFLRFWRERTRFSLWIASSVIALGIITKTNAYLFIPTLCICILCMREIGWKKKFRWLVESGVIVGILAGWYPLLRFLEQGMKHFSFGTDILKNDPSLQVGQSFSAYTVFNPLSIITHPFTSSRIAGLGKEHLWEYFFKTALFGEFSYSHSLLWTSRPLVVVTLCMLCVVATGMIVSIHRKDRYAFPMLTLAAVLLGGAMLFRGLYAYSCTQDFRMSILLVVPLLYFVIQAMTALPPRFARITRWTAVAFGACAAAFLIHVIIVSLL